ncbi:Colicin V secretion protein CvaA [Serratia rubidaea]|uniref:Colicin V secretion protein CvaA n=1 Tax=Serratia rubidaea TaxID=61652 RepID=A0A4U9HA56_SERRU|nr:HlyD family efflux transporter periplasmic adaptor subunit [Serratia rubidaea]MCR0996543.1 HlyD family secretion protein [Serratia rubidaea]QPR65674.1 HlyD family efflux transporter periplasmic adaptor subunit [Serratia rubidaea]CAI0865161.1 Colicin V secretion protein CvaA [Serratia rubidaea]CAI1672634.1 Colicin V secretion protein CvaA [Serratia rubidaea]VTP60447.1 Colicin V secretion protein CvaA [Serratia rubidaea]
MDNENSLFRQEALQHKKNAWLGDFTVSAPSALPIALWSAAGVLLLATLLLFTTYTKRVPVSGRVIYTPSAAEAVFSHEGIIGRIEVRQGEKVKKGDVIATFSRDVTYAGGGMNQALQDTSQRQLVELQKRGEERRNEGEEERRRLREKVSAKEREMAAIRAAAAAESERVGGLKKRLGFYQQLFQKGVATVQEKIERENEYHDSVAQLNMHHINIARVQGERLQLVDELARSEAQEKQALTEIQQQEVTLQQQVISASAVVESRVIAPLDGVVASMSIMAGQRVTAGAIAAVLVPENARPLVEMWIPPSALQEVKTGQHVSMRVASLPWEWFGKVPGTVAAISASPEALTGNHRRFRVLIAPDADTQALPAGVDVEADILTTRRRIWQWLFLPLKQTISRIVLES